MQAPPQHERIHVAENFIKSYRKTIHGDEMVIVTQRNIQEAKAWLSKMANIYHCHDDSSHVESARWQASSANCLWSFPVLDVRRRGEEGKLISAAVLASAFAAVAQLLCTSGSIVLGVQLGHHRRRTEKPDVGWLLETTACLLHSAAIEKFDLSTAFISSRERSPSIIRSVSTSSRNFSISVTCICTSRKAQKASQWTKIDKSNQAAMSTSCDDSKFTSPTAASRAQSLADEIFGCNGLKQLVLLVLAHLCDCNAIFDHLQSIFKNKRRRRTVYHQGLCGMNLLELVERDCTYCKIRKEMFVWGGLIGNDSVK
ncbi:conserved hypothetical protein [Trichinella spiralis]|uniref:hypothetical protein n=1 Tax=Trichinella spiralis TaxID=6334 RepID=UPI0001EFE932|nr:conserved hypothetical protein [Trichinella spiralis]